MLRSKILLVLISSLLFFSCTNWYSLPEQIKKQGSQIENYPKWAQGLHSESRISEWKDWQAEESKNLRELVLDDLEFNQNEKVKDYSGQYRISVGRHSVFLEFDNGCGCGLFYLFVRALTKKNWNEKYYIPQEKDSEFIYSGTAKYGHDGHDAGKFYCKMLQGKEEANKKYFSYLLEIDDKTVIDENLFVYTKREENSYYEWVEDSYFNEDGHYACGILFDEEQNSLYFFDVGDPSLDESVVLNEDNTWIPYPPYHGGMKEISVDKANKTVEYQLFDGSPKAENFLEIKILEDKKESLWTWFDKDSDGKRINEREETLYLYIRERGEE